MSKRTLLQTLFFLQLSLFAVSHSKAQCTTANLNWDNLDYLTTNGNYSGFVTNAMALTQNFAVGTNRLTIAVGNNITLNGQNTTHTGETGSYGTGADVSFTTGGGGSRTITLTFDVEVKTFKLSIYDLDLLQRFDITAKNAANVSQSITLTKPAGGTVVIAGSPGTAPSGTGNAANYANNVNTGTLNIDIAGPVKTITLSFSVNAGDFWLSDISACVTTSFTNSYYIVAKPFTGQPTYVLSMVDNNVYYTNVANGVSVFLFSDPGHTNLNSLGYDPYKGFIYYAYTLTGSPSTDKAIKKYDVSTGSITTVLADVTTLGIPVFENGVEVGAGAFYDGSYYLGIEAYSTGVATGRKSSIWRIDFNSSNVPYRASQVYASTVDAGTTIIHDWGDIGFSNGMLYDFDAASGGNDDYYHYNMQTGAITQYNPVGTSPSQTSVAWDEKLYNVNGSIMLYNQDGTVGTQYVITSTPPITAVRWGDAGEAFRPPVDFGDAPATYDPSAADPALHVASSATLRIGAAVSIEAVKRGTSSTEDTYEDGLATTPLMPPGSSQYLAQVSVYNNTGSNATLCAWLDYNGNGVFNSGEGITQVVATNASSQLKYLYWPSFSTPLTNGSTTYLRIRFTSTSNGMTTSNPTGYFANGEVEDYKVIVDNYPLAVSLLSFDIKAVNNNKVKLNWSANEEVNFNIYEVQRSNNGTDWDHFAFVDASHSSGIKSYELTDDHPYKGVSYYRLRLGEDNGVTKYSAVRSVTINDLAALVTITPNPASDHVIINILNNNVQTTALVKVLGMYGNVLHQEKLIIRPGDNSVNMPIRDSWSPGMYVVQVTSNGETANKKLLINR